MYESIMVTLDGSDLAEMALPYAEELAGKLHSNLTLLHICDPSDTNGIETYFDDLEKRTRQNIQKRYGAANPVVETVFQEGRPAETIIDFAQRNAIDLTIMATHGRSGISRWAMGGVADKVLRGIASPVALIRATGSHAAVASTESISRILLPLDGSPEGEAALPYVRKLAQKLNAVVILLHIVSKDEYPREINWIELRALAECNARSCLNQVEHQLLSEGIEVKSEVGFGNPAAEIIEFTATNRADVVAMSTHGRSGINRWAFGSVAEKVLRAGNVPVFLVRAPGACGN